jgi:hypothetical protein
MYGRIEGDMLSSFFKKKASFWVLMYVENQHNASNMN